MVWKKILFIFNPVSGRSQIKNNLMEIIEILSGADFKVVCYATKASGDARRIVREREDDYLYIVCAGGDGTLDEVVSGMMESRDKPFVPIGYIPAGTTNDFATNLHIPSDMRMAAEVISHGKTFRCDLGRFNRKDYFTYVAAFGVFTGTSYQTPQELKNQLGHFAYILQGVSELGKMRAYHMHVKAIEAKEAGNRKNSSYDISPYDVFEADGRKDADNTQDVGSLQNVREAGRAGGRKKAKEGIIDIEDDFAFGMITNSRSIGGIPNITGPDVDLQDGLFEVTLIRLPRNPLEMSEIVMALGNTEIRTEMVTTFKTSRITFSCEEKIDWTRDGEYAGGHKRVTLENIPGQLRILVPEKDGDFN